MYTPEDLSEVDVISHDRPYAGYGYLGTALFRGGTRHRDRIQIDAGAVGPITGAGEIQAWSHEMWGGAEPLGWHNQLSNEPALQLHLERVYRFR